MPGTPSTVLVTIGTHILTTLRTAAADFEAWTRRLPEDERALSELHRVEILAAATASAQGNWDDAGVRLASLPGRLRVLGADVSSLVAMVASGVFAGLRNVVLLHGDSEEGAGAAAIAKGYLREGLGLSTSTVRVPGLQAAAPPRFAGTGRRNLVRELAAATRRAGGPEYVVLNATGSPRPLVAMAAAFGQAHGVRVVCRSEGRGGELVEILPLPLLLDLPLALEHLDLLRQEVIGEDALAARFGSPFEASPAFARFSRFLEEAKAEEDGVTYRIVSPLADLVLDRWLGARVPVAPALPGAPRQMGPTWGSRAAPLGADRFAERLIKKYAWIVRLDVVPGEGRTRGSGVRFRLGPPATGVPDLYCEHVAGGEPATFSLKTTAKTMQDQESALRWLVHAEEVEA